MRQRIPQRPRRGHPLLGLFLLLGIGFAAIAGWPMYLDSYGTQTRGVITEKLETVRVTYGEWFRRFQIVAAYRLPGLSTERHAICDVDEKTFDSLHKGNTVSVHYVPGLLQQPFVSAAHLSPCSPGASISWNPAVMRSVIIAGIAFIGILFLWRVLRIRLAAWLLVPWLALSVAALCLPRTEPVPRHQVPATATVTGITNVTTLGGAGRDAIELSHPYQVVRLQFTPPGSDAPVVAVDKIDTGSLPNLQEGHAVPIVYEQDHPRIASLQGGTRLFPGRALRMVVLLCLVFIVLVSLASFAGWLFRLLIGNPVARAARMNSGIGRGRWRL